MEPEDDVFDISKLTFNGDFEQQVSELMDYIRLTKEDVLCFNGLVADLHSVFNEVWSDIYVHPFGSIVTGLGIRSSDVDCYIELPACEQPADRGTIIKAKNILSRHSNIFQHAFAIVNAKVPIVQFYHAPTRTYCDINFNSCAGVMNSQLIQRLLNTNTKALQLALLVKYWSKIHNLTGTHLMSSYCMTLLVIFYLQQINMLPPVEDLQKDVEKLMINEWNFEFSAPKCSNWDNCTSIYELLGEFFNYYKNFEFNKYIVSPYLGKPINMELFVSVESVPSSFCLYKTNIGDKNLRPLRLDCVMCVQDPFEHNRNCALPVHAKLGLKICAMFQKAASIYETGHERIFLKELLLRSTPENIPAAKKKKNHPLKGIKKNYRQNINQNQVKKQVNQTIRQYFAGRGRVRGNWRGNRGKFHRQ